jgi:hypothetical protein
VLALGLAKKREQRIQTVRELGDALARFLLDRGVDSDITGVPLASVWNVAGSSVARRSSTSGKTVSSESVSSAPTGAGVVLTRIDGRRLRASPQGHPFAAAVIVGAAALLVPTSFLASAVGWKNGVEAASRSTVVAAGAASAASQTIPEAPPLAPERKPVPPLAPLVRSAQDLSAPADPAALRAPNQKTDKTKATEAPKLRGQRPATDDETLRVLGLKAPYP